MKTEKRALTLYLLIVLILSAPLEAAWLYYGEAGAGLAPLAMTFPLIAALIVKFIFFRKQKVLGLGLGKPAYYFFAILIPTLYIGLSYILYWLFAPGSFVGIGALTDAILNAVNINNAPAAITIAIILSLLMNLIFCFGEEAGWRGLMYPLMHTMWGRNKALLISGGIWAVWHMAPLAAGLYMAGAPVYYQIPMFTIHIIAISVGMSWLRMKSGSVWPAVIWHALHNLYDQAIFRTMTAAGNSSYFISETGVITTLCAVLSAVLILTFGKFEKTCEQPQK